MAIRNIGQIYCSLNLGMIYSVNYSWSPVNGSEITLYFANEQGSYNIPTFLRKTEIRIGNASFSMYPVEAEIQYSSGRRVIRVLFFDETYQLDKYYISLTGKGCGFNVFNLGDPVDNRTLQQKRQDAINPDAKEIENFTQFPDIEYTFGDFLNIVRQKFSVQTNAFYDTNLTNSFVGTFRQVLNEWCSLFNLSWFIENGNIKIFDPTKLNIMFPSQPNDAIEYSLLEDVRDTYGKTCMNWFQQQGGQFELNQTSNSDGALLVRTDTLYPIGYEFGLRQTLLDLNQVAAAQFGPEFWFLYNYYKGTTSTECGWTPITVSSSLSINRSVTGIGARIAAINQNLFNQKYEAYQKYGQNIAGRFYISNEKSELAIDETYQWFDESNGQIFTFTNVDDKALSLEFLTPTTSTINIIPQTAINTQYSGINYIGNRIIYEDPIVNATSFNLTPTQQALINSSYQTIYSVPGSDSLDFNSQLAPIYGNDNTYVGYMPIVIPQDLSSLFDNISNYTTGFEPRFTSFPIKGINKTDYSTLKSSQIQQSGVQIVNNNEGDSIISNTAVIKTLERGSYIIYYNKYSDCASAHSSGPYFGHKFDIKQISNDNQIGISFQKQSENVYKLNRNFSVINALVNNPILPELAQARSFNTKRVSYTLNYFDNLPSQFLTNGLVGLNVSIGENGILATYSFSNEVLEVPNIENKFSQFEQMIRNSWIRNYYPTQVIS